MPIRDRIREVKHLQNKYFICVLENPKDIVNIASAMRNISAFGVEKLYVIGKNEMVNVDCLSNKMAASLMIESFFMPFADSASIFLKEEL